GDRVRVGCGSVRALGKLCQSEIQNLNNAVRTHHYVLRLDISMGYSGGMRSRQRACNLNRNLAYLGSRHSRRGNPLAKRYALDELGGDKMNRLDLADLKDGDQVRMIEC